MTPKLIVFDCDGVLVDTETVTDVILADNLSRHGLTVKPHEVHKLFVGGTMQGVADMARSMGATLPDDWVDAIYTDIFARLAQGVDVIAGVMDLLDLLDANSIATAIASNGPMAKMRVSLPPSGLWDRFDGRIYSGHDYTPKPAPDMVHHAMQVAGATAAQTIMIDDSTAGCMCGINAGVRVFGFAEVGQDDALRAIGAEVINRMDQVPALIGLA